MTDDALKLERARRGKNNRARGNAIERWVCKVLGVTRVGHFGGKADGGKSNEWIAVQVKSGQSYPERLDKWLSEVPRRADQLRALVVTDAPGPGVRRRAMVIIHLDEFAAWYGGPRTNDEEVL